VSKFRKTVGSVGASPSQKEATGQGGIESFSESRHPGISEPRHPGTLVPAELRHPGTLVPGAFLTRRSAVLGSFGGYRDLVPQGRRLRGSAVLGCPSSESKFRKTVGSVGASPSQKEATGQGGIESFSEPRHPGISELRHPGTLVPAELRHPGTLVPGAFLTQRSAVLRSFGGYRDLVPQGRRLRRSAVLGCLGSAMGIWFRRVAGSGVPRSLGV
jgi:hypothetical protein